MGHSIGEYAALVACGALSFEESMRLVVERGKLMSECKLEASNSMVAVMIKCHMEKFRSQIGQLTDLQVDIAAVNSSKQIILSGLTADIEEILWRLHAFISYSKSMDNVSHPFHSRFMNAARIRFSEFLVNAEINPVQGQFIANVTGNPADSTCFTSLLAEQITSTVQWKASIDHALLSHPKTVFLEVGPKSVLSSLLLREHIGNPVISLAAELETGRVTIDDGGRSVEKQISRACLEKALKCETGS